MKPYLYNIQQQLIDFSFAKVIYRYYCENITVSVGSDIYNEVTSKILVCPTNNKMCAIIPSIDFYYEFLNNVHVIITDKTCIR